MLIRNSKTLRPYLFRAFYEWFIDSNITLHIVVKLDEGVQVPVKFKGQTIITLSLTPSAIRNFEIGDEDISFNTKFSGVDEFIVIPYTAMLNFIDVEDQIVFPLREILTQELPSDYFTDEDEEKKEESEDDLFSTVEDVIEVKDNSTVKDLSAIKDNKEDSEDKADDKDDDLFSFVKTDK